MNNLPKVNYVTSLIITTYTLGVFLFLYNISDVIHKPDAHRISMLMIIVIALVINTITLIRRTKRIKNEQRRENR